MPWFFHSGYLFFTDLTWGPNINLDWTNSGFFVNILVWFFSFLFPIDFLQKIYIGLAIFTVLIGGKKIADHFIRDKFGTFITSLFVVFNPFVYDRLLFGQVSTVFALGFLLLSVGCLLEYLEKRENKQSIIFGVYTAFTLQFSAHFVFFIGLIFLFFLLMYLRKWGLERELLKSFVKSLLLVIIICFCLNVNWLAGDFFSKTNRLAYVDSGITRQDLFAFKTAGSSDAQVLTNVLMMSGFWGKDQYRYIDLVKIENNWGRSFLLLLPIILLGIFMGLKKKDTRSLSVSLLIIFVLSVILSSGVSLSFSSPLSYWFFEHIPLYKSLRETQKWSSVIVLVYSIFLSIGIVSLLKTKIISVHKYIFLLFFGATIIMQAVFILWGFAGQVRPVQYPLDWQIVNQEIECRDGERILFLPWHAYMSFTWIGKIVANPAEMFFNCSTIVSTAMEWKGIYDNSGNKNSQRIKDWLDYKGDSDLLIDNEINIRYILLVKELDWDNYFWLDSLSGLVLEIETPTLKFYKISN